MATWKPAAGCRGGRGPLHYPRPPRRPQARPLAHGRRPPRPATYDETVCAFVFAVLALAAGAAIAAVRPENARHASPAAPAPPQASAPPAAAPSNPGVGASASTGGHAGQETAIPVFAPGASAAISVALVPVVPPVQGRRLAVELTAYSASEEEGTTWGIAYSGVPVRPGTVAVDPAVIPLGSRLHIAGLPGVYRAEDTGGGIRGAHIDVFIESRAAALEFGRRRNVTVEILN